MPNAEEQGTKTIEFSPIGKGNKNTGITPETKKKIRFANKNDSGILHGENRSDSADENKRKGKNDNVNRQEQHFWNVFRDSNGGPPRGGTGHKENGGSLKKACSLIENNIS